MKLLLFTQALDKNDPTLSAYHRLVAEIAKNFAYVTVICLKKGEYDLPPNVKVLSLGKEEGRSRAKYVRRFYKYIFSESYDSVFVHMNQEYVLLGGVFWRLMRKPAYMWRNHHAGTFLTDIAAAFCTKVFCTSKFSFTAKYKKTVLMPVGIDTELFKPQPVSKKPRSVLFLARIAPVKKPHVLLDAFAKLRDKSISFTASLYGDPLPKDVAYSESLRKKAADLGLLDNVSFYPGVPNDKTPETYSAHEIFVNLSSSGMYDKTIFEAMASETLTLATNKNLEGLVDPMFIGVEDDANDIASKLEKLLGLTAAEKEAKGRELRAVTIREHSLRSLGEKIARELGNTK
jgi:glycosyltransferase involved in cell wall biosynthesis